MDVISLAVGFLVGAITGATGNYLADKYTDVRREKKALKKQAALWQDVERRFPAVISEMREAFADPDSKGIRAFFVKDSRSMIGFLSEPCFEFHTDKHPDLQAAVLHLERLGLISDITPGNCPMYRVHEELVDWLVRPNESYMDSPSTARG